jgi:hypothetical protein
MRPVRDLKGLTYRGFKSRKGFTKFVKDAQMAHAFES